MRSFFFFLNSAEESFLAFFVETILFPIASNFSSSFSMLVRDGEKKESLWKTYFVIITLQSWSRTLSLHPVMSTGRHFAIPKLLVSTFQIVLDIGAIGGGVRGRGVKGRSQKIFTYTTAQTSSVKSFVNSAE